MESTLSMLNTTVLHDVNDTITCYLLPPQNYCTTREKFLEILKEYTFPTPMEWLFALLHIAVFVVGTIGNLLVCFVVWRSRHMQTVTNLFIVNLAVADFLVFVTCQPPTVLQNITETWFLGRLFCKIAIFFQNLCVSSSVLTLCAISVERYYAICRPLKAKITSRKVGIAIAFIWMIGIIVALPNLLFMEIENTYADIDHLLVYCGMSLDPNLEMIYQLFIVLSTYLVPVFIMGVFYSIVSIHLWSAAAPGAQARNPRCNGHHSPIDAQLLSRRKVAKMLIAIVVIFFICYLPIHLLFIARYSGLLKEEDENHPLLPVSFLFSHWLCYFNNAINPVIYNFMSVKFRDEFRSVFSCSSPPQGRLYPSGTWTRNKFNDARSENSRFVKSSDL
ncbi:orexin receptor type 2-like [Gigantopelta aegis]|uniref:orexin receptor type 2-like n=1 Tax=Gigantopelta aegis TaxID=1735272 RepID=UPI001B88976B|nr:orexin receptor type 2-like [Gigantopelta aegis]